MTRNKTMMWIHPSFKRKIKKEAADKGLSILGYTEELGKSDGLIIDELYQKIESKNDRKKKGFGLEF